MKFAGFRLSVRGVQVHVVSSFDSFSYRAYSFVEVPFVPCLRGEESRVGALHRFVESFNVYVSEIALSTR